MVSPATHGGISVVQEQPPHGSALLVPPPAEGTGRVPTPA